MPTPTPTINLDRIKDSQLSLTVAGIEVVRSIFVSNVPVSTTNPDSTVLLAATFAPGMPKYGDPHPNNAEYGIFLTAREFAVKPSGGNNSCWVLVTYTSFRAPSVSGVLRNYSGGIMQEVRDTDRNGNPINVLYTAWNGNAGDVPTGGKVLKAGATVQAPMPYRRILITRYFTGTFDTATWIDNFIGCRNNGVWASEGIPSFDGLVMNVEAVTQDGFNYTATWDIMARPQGWDAFAAYVLPSGQRPYNAYNGFFPGNTVAANNGFAKIVVVRADVDFNVIS